MQQCRALRLTMMCPDDDITEGVKRDESEWKKPANQHPKNKRDVSIGLMSLKKKHEIIRLGDCIIETAKKNRCNVVVDMGCGKGYLTNYVKMNCPDLVVIGIEGNPNYSKSYQKRTDQLKEKMKHVNGEIVDKTEVISAMVPVDVTDEQFMELIRNHVPKGEVRIVLVGLHTCGNLASAMLNLFFTVDAIKSIVSVGCCYHMITEDPSLPAKAKGIIHKDSHAMSTMACETHEKVNTEPISLSTSTCQTAPCTALKNGFPLSKFLSEGEYCIPFHLDTGKYMAANPLPEHQPLDDLLAMAKAKSFRAALEYLLHIEVTTNGDMWVKMREEKEKQTQVPGEKRCRSPTSPPTCDFPLCSSHLESEKSPHAEIHFVGHSPPASMENFAVYCHNAFQQLSKRIPRTDYSEQHKKKLECFLEMALAHWEQCSCVKEKLSSFYSKTCGAFEFSNIVHGVSCYASVQHILGPVLEGLIVADRCLFLNENGAAAVARRLFRPEVSPRGIVIIANKTTDQKIGKS
eukprot:TRINITY_DN11270_c0_g1_i3.p1 TRINITY_DN11270_c0_g1~~TRINITY_DN11270_c0_g1_i3.p1  ORF type:complete len:517 (-),score=132.98 TRINITY_DN11270_c0_g1_i3:54-1604(-)